MSAPSASSAIVRDRSGTPAISARELIPLYWRLVRARARGQLQYRLSFAILAAGTIAATLADYLAVRILFDRIPRLAGWSFAEVALMFGLTIVCFSVAEIPTPGFDTLPRQLVQGSFDRVLTRPLGAFFQILATDVSPRKIVRALLGAVIVGGAQGAIPVAWTPDRVVVLALALSSGVAIFFSIFVIGAASTFWTVQANEMVNVFTHGGVTMLTYPLDVYHDWLKRFVTFVIPLGFVSYYPSLYVLGRPDALGLPAWIGFLSPVAAVAFAVLAWGAWTAGVRHYSSVGN